MVLRVKSVRIFIIFLTPLWFFLIPGSVSANFDLASYTEAAWKNWQKKAYSKYLNNNTSYLNAVSLAKAQPQQSLFLHRGKRASDTKWSLQPSSSSIASAHFHGNNITLQIDGVLRDVRISPAKRMHEWKLNNGAYARMTLGSRKNKRAWGHVYDPKKIKSFPGFQFYPFNPDAVLLGTFNKQTPVKVAYRTFQDEEAEVFLIGHVEFEYLGKKHRLKAYNWKIKDATDKPTALSLMFTDNTADANTYGGGRELFIEFDEKKGIPEETPFVLDFNRSMNPYCVHSPFWHCPIGLQQKLDVSFDAGELLPPDKRKN